MAVGVRCVRVRRVIRMKKKLNRLSIVIMVLLVVAAVATLLTACSHDHEVLKWKTIKEPTCTTEGVERGACVDCGEVIEQPVATVADNHVWGEWEITVAPSYNRNGKGEAQRVCKENSEHKQTVSLPILSSKGTGYEEYEVFEEPTVVSEGRLSAVYASEYGLISFNVAIPKKEFDPESVEDAVYLGSSNKDLIRKGSGFVDSGFNPNGGHSYAAFNYEFGEDYMHSYDMGASKDLWVSRTSDGEIFAIAKYYLNDGKTDILNVTATELDFNGYHYNVSRADKDFYGAEGLLKNAYLWGKRNVNKDFSEGKTTSEVENTHGEVVNPNGETVYWFKFGYYSVPQYFCKVECRFMLTESGAIKYIVMYVDSYSRNPGRDEELKKGDQFALDIDPETNNSIAHLLEGCGKPVYNEVVEYTQELKADYPDEPVHEYTEDAFKVTNFNVTYLNDEGKFVVVSDEQDENALTFPTGGGDKSILLTLGDIYPDTSNFDYDPITIYRVLDNGLRVKLGSSPTSSNPVFIAPVDEDFRANTYTLRSYLAGYIRLVFVTESGLERYVTLYATYSKPTRLYPATYDYSDAGYVWRESSEKEMTATIYAGQSLTMKAFIAKDKVLYVDGTYTATIESGPDGATLKTIEDSDNVKFVADTPGEYVVKFTSVLNEKVAAQVKVTVNPAPDINELMTGEYNATLKKCVATVSFAPADADGKILATVTTNKGTEIISVYYDEQYKVIITEHADGASLGVEIELNEAYKLVLTNPTGFGSGRERAVMYVAETEEEA